MTGPALLQTLALVAGGVAAFAGLLFVLMEMGETSSRNRLRRRLGGFWRRVGDLGGAELAVATVGDLAEGSARFFRTMMSQAERGSIPGGLVLGSVLVLIPLAAALNAGLGGSPLLLAAYGTAFCLGIGVVVLAEGRWARAVLVLAGPALVIFFAAAPLYVARSLTEFVLYSSIEQAVFQALIVAIPWYLSAWVVRYAADFLWHGGRPPAGLSQFADAGFGALPFVFVLYFLGWLAGTGEGAAGRSWQGLASVMAAGGVSVACFVTLLAGRAAKGPGGLAVRLGLSFAAGILGAALILGIEGAGEPLPWSGAFWIAAIPLLPPLAGLGAVVMALGARIERGLIAGLSRGAAAEDRPFLSTGIGGWVVALAFWGAAALF